MKITTVREEVIRENNSKRTIVKIYGEVKPSDSREPSCLVPTGSYVGQGMSNCHPDDESDDVLGYRLARSRAYRNLYNIVLAEQMKLCNSFENLLQDTVYQSSWKYRQASKDQELDISRLLGLELEDAESGWDLCGDDDICISEETEARVKKIIEKFDGDGELPTSVRVTDIGDFRMGFYVYDETVFCVCEGSDFWFCKLSDEDQEEAVKKLVEQGDYEIDNSFC